MPTGGATVGLAFFFFGSRVAPLFHILHFLPLVTHTLTSLIYQTNKDPNIHMHRPSCIHLIAHALGL